MSPFKTANKIHRRKIEKIMNIKAKERLIQRITAARLDALKFALLVFFIFLIKQK